MPDEADTLRSLGAARAGMGLHHAAVESFMMAVRAAVSVKDANGEPIPALGEGFDGEARLAAVGPLLGAWTVPATSLTAVTAALVLDMSNYATNVDVTTSRPTVAITALIDLGVLLEEQYGRYAFAEAAYKVRVVVAGWGGAHTHAVVHVFHLLSRQSAIRLADGLQGQIPELGLGVVTRVRLAGVLAAQERLDDAQEVLDEAVQRGTRLLASDEVWSLDQSPRHCHSLLPVHFIRRHDLVHGCRTKYVLPSPRPRTDWASCTPPRALSKRRSCSTRCLPRRLRSC